MEQTNATNEAPKRPVFLTVLCILSFVAAGFAILGYAALIAVAGVATAAVGKLEDMAADSGGAMTMSNYSGPSAGMTWAYIIIGFLTTLIALFGVIKMWKLKKMGFYLYTGATVVSMIMSIVYTGFGPATFGLVISVGFIVMYGLNLKSMK